MVFVLQNKANWLAYEENWSAYSWQRTWKILDSGQELLKLFRENIFIRFLPLFPTGRFFPLKW